MLLITTIFLLGNLVEVSGISLRSAYTQNSQFCVAKPYVPGGGIRTVGEVKAPKATLETNKVLGMIATGASKTGNVGKVIGVFAKFNKIFKTASKMAPWLGALSGVFGLAGKTSTALDAVKAVNKAFKVFAKEITNRMTEMKEYVGDKVLESEAKWVKHQYAALMNGWTDCILWHREESEVNECQREALREIWKDRSHFLLYEGIKPNRQQLKRLEFQFLTIRDYAFLTLLVLRSLIDSTKAEEGKGKDYVLFLHRGMEISKEFASYAKFVNNEILDLYDTRTKTMCERTLTCGEVQDIGGNKWEPKYRSIVCKCKMSPDALDHEKCEYYVEINARDNVWWQDDRHDLKTYAKSKLMGISKEYWQQTSSVVRKFWYDSVMVQVPVWERFAVNAEQMYEEYRGTNHALGRPTSKSSTHGHRDSYVRYAEQRSSNAVDGNYKQCKVGQKSVSQTKPEYNPWWLVVLDGVYKVNTVILYSASDCTWGYNCGAPLSNVNIYMDDFGRKRSLCANTGDMKEKEKEFKCQPSAVGNVVFLQKQGHGSLELCEIKVYGERVNRMGENLALDRPTKQSTNSSQYSSSRSVDGKHNKCTLSEDTCSKAELQSTGSWWQVSLDTAYYIDNVLVYGCQGSLDDISISATEGHEDEPIIIGTEGGVECPAGYSLITDKDACQEKIPSAIRKTFHSQGCWEFEANGCFVNNGKDAGEWNNYVFFNHCNRKKQTTKSGYAPVCKKGQVSQPSMCTTLADRVVNTTFHNFNCEKPPYGKDLRITAKSGNLQLCEVEVYGRKFNSEKGDNIALRGRTEQYPKTQYPLVGSLAVDGNHMNCKKSRGTITLTRNGNYGNDYHHWRVRLPFLARVDTIVIYNREDCCTEQLSNADIWVIHEDDDYERTWTQQKFNETGNMKDVRAKEFTSQEKLYGHYVQIRMKEYNVPVSLCEVEVYGKKPTREEMKAAKRARKRKELIRRLGFKEEEITGELEKTVNYLLSLGY